MGVRMRYGATATTDNRSTYTDIEGGTVSQVTETVLWENEDTTVTFAAQAVPVTQSVLEFDSFRVYFYNYTSNAVGPAYIEIDSSQYDLFLKESTKLRFLIGYNNSRDTSYYRFCSIDGDSIWFGTCKQYDSTTTSNTNVIPYRVTGISKSEIAIPSRGNENVTVLWVNQDPNSAMAANTVITLSDGLENYDFVRVLYKPLNTSATDVDMWNDYYIGKNPTSRRDIVGNAMMTYGSLYSGTVSYARSLWVSSTTAPYTQVKVTNSFQISGSSGNTSSNIPLIICGVNYVDGVTSRISNNFTVATTAWSSTTVVYAGEDCYYADITITEFDGNTPVIYITSSDDEISVDSQKAYIAWKYATVDTTALKLRLYAPSVPEAEFTIHVEGVR